MDIPDNLPIATAFVILTIGWFSISIADIKTKLTIKILYSFLLATIVFFVFSIIIKDFSLSLYLMMIVMSMLQVSVKHFVDNYGDTYGQIDVLYFLKKKNKDKESNDGKGDR